MSKIYLLFRFKGNTGNCVFTLKSAFGFLKFLLPYLLEHNEQAELGQQVCSVIDSRVSFTDE